MWYIYIYVVVLLLVGVFLYHSLLQPPASQDEGGPQPLQRHGQGRDSQSPEGAAQRWRCGRDGNQWLSDQTFWESVCSWKGTEIILDGQPFKNKFYIYVWHVLWPRSDLAMKKTIKLAFLVDYCSSMIDLRGKWNAEIMDLPQPILVSIVLRKKYHTISYPFGVYVVSTIATTRWGYVVFRAVVAVIGRLGEKTCCSMGKVHGWREREGGRHIWRSFSQIRVFCVFLC